MVVDSMQENDATAKALGLGTLGSCSFWTSRTLGGVSHSGRKNPIGLGMFPRIVCRVEAVHWVKTASPERARG